MISDQQLLFLRSKLSRYYGDLLPYMNEHGINLYLVGSACFPFIKKPRDIDIMFIYPDIPNYMQVLQPLYERTEKVQDKLDYHVMFQNISKPSNGALLYSGYHINLFGTEEIVYDMFDPKYKMHERMRNHYIEYMTRVNHPKRMYDLLYYYYVRKNNSHTLTEEQIKKIKSWHDNNHDWDYLKQIITELGYEWIDPSKGDKDD